MSDPFIGQIIPVAFNFAPVGWLPCDGRLLSIGEYDTLFMLLGTAYGGDGQTTFGLPNLSGAAALGAGRSRSGSAYVAGQSAGSEQVTLNATQLGGHSHMVGASSQNGTTNTPGPTVIPASAGTGSTAPLVFSAIAPTAAMANASIGPAGSGQPHENRQPLVTINYIIATAGVYPQQN